MVSSKMVSDANFSYGSPMVDSYPLFFIISRSFFLKLSQMSLCVGCIILCYSIL